MLMDAVGIVFQKFGYYGGTGEWGHLEEGSI